MEPLGTKLRRQRRRMGLTLDELAGRTSISKPYLSLIETGRVPNPPSDEKLRRLEQSLGFAAGELVTQAHLQRTPRDVRAMLGKLLGDRHEGTKARRHEGNADGSTDGNAAPAPASSSSAPLCLRASVPCSAPVNLDEAYLSGVLQELVDHASSNVERVATNAVPVINKVSAGYPRDFTDLSYPPRVADDYVGCPEVQDKDAFAARVHGDSMNPKYHQGDIVIFSPAAAARDGDDCFVRFEDGHTTFKRIFFENDDTGSAVVRLQPRNERYRAQLVPSARITGLYRAVFKYMPVDGEEG